MEEEYFEWDSEVFCPKGHKCHWYQRYIDTCTMCNTSNCSYSRWKCQTCDENYCCKCLPPPVYGNKCPLEHEVEYKESLTYHSCDVCRESIQGPGYRDYSCDFDICLKCYRDEPPLFIK